MDSSWHLIKRSLSVLSDDMKHWRVFKNNWHGLYAKIADHTITMPRNCLVKYLKNYFESHRLLLIYSPSLFKREHWSMFYTSFKISATIRQYRSLIIFLKTTQISSLLTISTFSDSAITTFNNITLWASVMHLICVGGFLQSQSNFYKEVQWTDSWLNKY